MWKNFFKRVAGVAAACERAESARVQHAHHQWSAIQRGAAAPTPWR